MAKKKLFPATEADLDAFTDTIEFLNPSQSHAEFTESFGVPESLVYQMPVPKKGTTITITVEAASRTIITTGTPSATQVLVNRYTGKITFNANDEASTAEVTMTPLYTPQSAEYLNWQQAQVAEAIAAAGGDVVGPASATDGNLVLFDGTTGKLVRQYTGGDAVALRTALGLGTSSNVEFANGVFNGSGGVTATGERFRNEVDGGIAGLIAKSYGSVAQVVFSKINGSFALPTAIINSQPIGRFLFAGATTTSTTASVGSSFEVVSTENWSGSGRGCKMIFTATNNGTTIEEIKFETTNHGIAAKTGFTCMGAGAGSDSSIPNGTYFFDSENSNAPSVKNLSGTVLELATV